MRTTKLYLCVSAVLGCAVGQAPADVVATFWEVESPTVLNLYAAMSIDTVVFNADLADETIDLPPDGVNTGLYSAMGDIIFVDSFLTIGGMNPSFARPFTVTPSGTGSLVDAAWFVIGGVSAQFHPNMFSDYALQVGHFVVDDGAFLGGMAGGIQSRIFIGWEDDAGTGFGVFNIVPAPGSLALLLVGLAVRKSRRRT